MTKGEWKKLRMTLPDELKAAFDEYSEELENYIDSRVALEVSIVNDGCVYDADSHERMLGALFKLLLVAKTQLK